MPPAAAPRAQLPPTTSGPHDVYKAKAVDTLKRLAKEIVGNMPLQVINVGEVTARATVQKFNAGNMMSISMGSSEGGAYANKDGNLMGWMNEFATAAWASMPWLRGLF